MPIPCIEQLGSEVEEVWHAANYGQDVFPELAVEALSRARLPERLRFEDIVSWVFGERVLLQQTDPAAKFGQPPVTLFRARRFHIDALFWVDGATSIHQHPFSGAFQVLVGSSIETRYRFDLGRNVDGRFVLGQLHVDSTTILRRGDIRPIEAAGKLIHSLFHLERPSVTVVVRTYEDSDSGPQLEYSRSGIGHNPFFSDITRDRALQLVAMLRTTDHPDLERLVGDLVHRSDLHTAYRLLRDCSTMPDRALFDRLLDKVNDAAMRGLFREAFQEGRRLSFLQSRRNLVKDPDLRFLLGVLLNARRRVDVLELVHSHAPGDEPSSKVAAWLRELSRVTVKLQAAGAPWEPNLLGLPEFTDELEMDLARFLRGEIQDETRFAPFLAKLRVLPALACLFA